MDYYINRLPDKTVDDVLKLYKKRIALTGISAKVKLSQALVSEILKKKIAKLPQKYIYKIKRTSKDTLMCTVDSHLNKLEKKKMLDKRLNNIVQVDTVKKATHYLYVEEGKHEFNTMKRLEDRVISKEVFDFYVARGDIAFYKIYPKQIKLDTRKQIEEEYNKIAEIILIDKEFVESLGCCKEV